MAGLGILNIPSPNAPRILIEEAKAVTILTDLLQNMASVLFPEAASRDARFYPVVGRNPKRTGACEQEFAASIFEIGKGRVEMKESGRVGKEHVMEQVLGPEMGRSREEALVKLVKKVEVMVWKKQHALACGT